MSEIPLHVITSKKILGTTDLYIILNPNRTLQFMILSTQEKESTGQIKDINFDEKQDYALHIIYESKVRKIGEQLKQIKLKFDNSKDLDHFLAIYTSTTNNIAKGMDMKKSNDKAQITVFVATFNMGNKQPKEEFKQFLKDAEAKKPDIIFYAAQEADYGSSSVEDLFKTIVETLKNSYSCIVKSYFWEMRLVLLVKKRLEAFVSNVVASTEATGILGLMGNKGGVVACFNFFDSPIAFVSSHLNAHQGNVQRRNEDFKSICTLINLDNGPFDLLSGYHHVIWAGDLNYRIDKTYQEVVDATEKKDFESLWPEDQLNKQMQLGRTFNGFIEGKINFAPTYKFKKGTTKYDAESKRIPAWCDRVLIRSFDGLERKCLSYSHHDSVTTSDHHPVSALWEIDVVMTPPPPAPFASIIGVRPYIELNNLTLDIGAPIDCAKCQIIWPFSEPMDLATGKGRKNVQWPDDTIPLLVPTNSVSTAHLKTQYIHLVFKVNEKTAIAIIPLHFAAVDVSRPFHVKAEYKLEQIGTVTGSLKIVLASESHITEQHLRHQKANQAHNFQTIGN